VINVKAGIHSGKFSADRNGAEQILLWNEQNRCSREIKVQAKQMNAFLLAQNFPE